MKQKFTGSLLLLMILIFTNNLLAQTGTLKGIVRDENGEPAFDVTVFIPASKQGAVTGFEGEYEILNIPPGVYKIYFKGIGFIDSLTGVEIKADEIKVLDKNISSSGAINVEIVREKDHGSVVSQIEEVKKNETQIVQLGGEQIRKGSDRNAADALRRLPGVTLVDNRFIMVRGLAERYNSVWLNDVTAPSTEADKRAFSFDIIQSSLIEKIQVYKTPSPDLPGDFAGGMTKIYTRASAPKKDFQISLQGSYRPGSTFNTMELSNTEKLDILGFGSKARTLPEGIPDKISKGDANNSEVSKSFKNTWGIHKHNTLPDIRFGAYYANRFKIKNMDLGNTTAISYSNQNTIFNIDRYSYDDTVKLTQTKEKQSTNLVNLGLIQNFSLIINAKNSIQFRNLFNQNARNQTTIRDNVLTNSANKRTYGLSYQSRQIYTTQISGTHGNESTFLEGKWTGGFSYSNKKDPDLRRIQYLKNQGTPDSLYAAGVPTGGVDGNFGGGRYFANLYERTYTLNGSLKIRPQISNYKFEANVGVFAEHKERFFDSRLFGYVLFKPTKETRQFLYLPIDQIFSESQVGVPNGFKIDEATTKGDSYNAQNNLIATYGSVSLPIGDRLKLLTGARYEHNVQKLQGFIGSDSISPEAKTKFLLPSANLTYKFSEKSLLRFACGKTLNRPEFREWSPFYFYDFEFNASTTGSLYPTLINRDPQDETKGRILKVAQIWNFDARYELYPSILEMFHVGVFYKNFKDPIQQVYVTSSEAKLFTYTNATSAYTYGVEIDIRKNLGFIDSLINTNFMSKLNLVANGSIIKSEVTNPNVINQASKNPLIGQSPYAINTGLYFETGNDSTSLQVSLLYNVFGSRIIFVGTLDDPNIGELPRNTLDLTINKTISKRIGIIVSIQDILNQPVKLVQDTNQNGKFERSEGKDKPFMSYKRGQYFTAGIRIKL